MKPDLKNTTASPDVESNKNFFFVKYLTHPSNEILFNFALFKLIIEKIISVNQKSQCYQPTEKI